MEFRGFFKFSDDLPYKKLPDETKEKLRGCFKQNKKVEKIDLLIKETACVINWSLFWQKRKQKSAYKTIEIMHKLEKAATDLDKALSLVARNSLASHFVESALSKEYKSEKLEQQLTDDGSKHDEDYEPTPLATLFDSSGDKCEEEASNTCTEHVDNLIKSISGIKAACEDAKRSYKPKPGPKADEKYWFVEQLMREYRILFGSLPGLTNDGPFHNFTEIAGMEAGFSIDFDLIKRTKERLIRDDEAHE